MRLLLSIILIFALSIGLALAVGSNGSVSIVWQNYKVDLSLATFLVISFLLFIIGMTIKKLWVSILFFPDRLMRQRKEKVALKKRRLVTDMLIYHLLGDQAMVYASLKKLKKNFLSSRNSDLTEGRLLSLVALSCNEKRFSLDEKNFWLEELKRIEKNLNLKYSKSELIVADRALEEGLIDGLAQKLSEFLGRNPNSFFGRELLVKVLLVEKKWEEILLQSRILINQDENKKKQYEKISEKAVQGMLTNSKGISSLTVKKILGLLKDHEMQNPNIIGQLAVASHKVGNKNQCSDMIEKYLNKKWDTNLCALYWKYPSDTKRQLKALTQWEKKYGNNSGYHTCFGNICILEELWGKAKDHLKASIKLSPSRDAYSSLAKIYEITQDLDNANKFWKIAATLPN